MNRQNFKHIPDDVFDQKVKRFMKYLRELDKTYKTSEFRTIEKKEIIDAIMSMVDIHVESRAFGKIFIKQLKTYFLEKYLHPKFLTRTEIGELVGYSSNSTHRHSMTIHNCKSIENYLCTKDLRYYGDILEVDSKIENVLI